MKTCFVFLITIILSTQAFSQQAVAVGDRLPDIKITNCILPESSNMVISSLSLNNFSGQVIILDFWATWCGPCISAMSKYEKFQKKYAGKLQVIGITHEQVKRIQRFVLNRPVGFMLAVDTASALRAYFDYRTIPHVVLIDKQGKIQAITSSENVTEEVIENLLAGREISLPLKKDRLDFDIETHFNAAPDAREAFNLQPGVEGAGSMSKLGHGNFEKRRISLINFTIDGLYRMAYRISSFRTVIDADPSMFEYQNIKNRYCLDVIVPRAGDDLYAYMQQQLPKHFDIAARWEKRNMQVLVVKRTDGPLKLESSTEQNDYYSASSNHFNGTGVRISALAEFLESFGLFNMPVIDETNVSGRYNIQLEWQPEKKGHFREVFRNAGFEVVKEDREIDVLVLSR